MSSEGSWDSQLSNSAPPKSFLRNLKKKTFAEALENSIPVLNDRGNELGKLVLSGSWALEHSEYINSMTLWRIRYASMFLSRFPVTVEGTYSYLKDVVIRSDNRLLFFIFNTDMQFVGHIGLIAEGKNFELDNIIRGEDCIERNMMYFVICSLLKECQAKKTAESYYLHVFSHNQRAIYLYKNVGFQIAQEYFLLKKQAGEKVTHTIVKKSSDSNCDYTYLKMILPKNWKSGRFINE